MTKIKPKRTIRRQQEYKRFCEGFFSHSNYRKILKNNPTRDNYLRLIQEYNDGVLPPDEILRECAQIFRKDTGIFIGEKEVKKEVRERELGTKVFDIISYQKKGQRQVFAREEKVTVKGKQKTIYRDSKGRFSSLKK